MIRVVVPPPVEPLSIEDARRYVRGSCGDEDDLVLGGLIAAARARAEHLTQRVFVQRTVEVGLQDFRDYRPTFGAGPSLLTEADALPAPIISVGSVKYSDVAGVEQIVDPASYALFDGDQFGLRFVAGYAFPPVQPNRPDAVRIQLVVGYPPSTSTPPNYAANLPAELLQWMRMNVAGWYAYREPIVAGRSESLPPSMCDSLLDGLILARRFA